MNAPWLTLAAQPAFLSDSSELQIRKKNQMVYYTSPTLHYTEYIKLMVCSNVLTFVFFSVKHSVIPVYTQVSLYGVLVLGFTVVGIFADFDQSHSSTWTLLYTVGKRLYGIWLGLVASKGGLPSPVP